MTLPEVFMTAQVTLTKASWATQLRILQEPRLSKVLPDSPSMLALPDYLKKHKFAYYHAKWGKYEALVELYKSKLSTPKAPVFEFHPMVPHGSLKVSRHLLRVLAVYTLKTYKGLYALTTSSKDRAICNMILKVGATEMSTDHEGKTTFILTRNAIKDLL